MQAMLVDLAADRCPICSTLLEKLSVRPPWQKAGQSKPRPPGVLPESFQIGLRNRDDGNGLSKGVENLHDATLLAISRVGDEVQLCRHISPPEVVLEKIALERDALVEGKAHLEDGERLFVRSRKIPRLQEQVDPVQDFLDSRWREIADLLDQVFFVDGEKLRDVDNAALRKVGLTEIQEYVPRSGSSFQMRGERTDDHGGKPALIDDVVLHDHVGMQEGRPGT